LLLSALLFLEVSIQMSALSESIFYFAKSVAGDELLQDVLALEPVRPVPAISLSKHDMRFWCYIYLMV
jgi:hypothetical protein